VVIETFTFLDPNANRDVALTWKEAHLPRHGNDSPCGCAIESSLGIIFGADLHKLSAVDATSFASMKRARIRLA
jgi:hypothetical protein